MDFNKLKALGESALSGSSGQNQGQTQGGQSQQDGGNTNNQQQGGSSDQEDYGDKGLDFLEKKAGYTQSRETNEKITDGARGLFEKFSGKHIDPKYSN